MGWTTFKKKHFCISQNSIKSIVTAPKPNYTIKQHDEKKKQTKEIIHVNRHGTARPWIGHGSLNQKLNDVVETRWKRWGRADSCDVAGRLSWVEMQKLIVNSLVVDGEVFIRIINKKFVRSRVSFALEILERDRLDNNYEGVANNKKYN